MHATDEDGGIPGQEFPDQGDSGQESAFVIIAWYAGFDLERPYRPDPFQGGPDVGRVEGFEGLMDTRSPDQAIKECGPPMRSQVMKW